MKKCALVTGANGFVGQTLCKYLQTKDWDIVAVDKEPSDQQTTSYLNFVPCDITDLSSVKKLFRKNSSVTHIFHLAAITFVPDSRRSPVKTMEVNLNGTINIIEGMKQFLPQARMLFVSSSEVYGPPVNLPVTENHPLNPQNPYAISKMAADSYCKYEASLGTNIVIMRPFNHSGTGQSFNFVLSDFCRQIVQIEHGLKEPVLKVGNLNSARDFSHVDDIVKAYELAALKGDRGAVYNVCSGTSTIISEILQQIIKEAGVEVTIEIDAKKYRPIAVPEIRGSFDLLAKLGWEPEKYMTDIISDLLRYWREELKES